MTGMRSSFGEVSGVANGSLVSRVESWDEASLLETESSTGA